MKTVLINYADRAYKNSQHENTASALKHGINEVVEYGYNSLPVEFRERYKDIFSMKRGAGYWIWKAKIIQMTMDLVDEGDIVFYSDAGCHFIKDIDPLIEICEKEEIVLFDVPPDGAPQPHHERLWTKRDIFVALGADTDEIHNSTQIMSGFQIYKKGEKSKKLVSEYLKWSCWGRLLTDESNTLGKPNINGFKENRHDQSILSVSAKKIGIIGHRDLSQHGNNFVKDYPKDTYSQIVDLQRKRNW